MTLVIYDIMNLEVVFMETKVCDKCRIEKNIDSFEFRKDRNNYRNTCKECRNEQRRKYYLQNHETILEKKRERYKNDPKYKEYRLKSDRNNKTKRSQDKNDIKVKIKNQLKGTLDKSFVRKGLKREKSYEDLLCCGIDEAVDYLLDGYKKKYGKELSVNDNVDIDHILSLRSAYRQENVEKLCCYKNLRILSKRDNHNRKYKITKDEQQLIKEFKDFYRTYKKNKQ